MKVKELRKLIENLPDDAPVMTASSDHSLREVAGRTTTGLQMGPRDWTEDFGEAITPEAKYGKRRPILLIES